jgi:hypothetical protein
MKETIETQKGFLPISASTVWVNLHNTMRSCLEVPQSYWVVDGVGTGFLLIIRLKIKQWIMYFHWRTNIINLQKIILIFEKAKLIFCLNFLKPKICPIFRTKNSPKFYEALPFTPGQVELEREIWIFKRL